MVSQARRMFAPRGLEQVLILLVITLLVICCLVTTLDRNRSRPERAPAKPTGLLQPSATDSVVSTHQDWKASTFGTASKSCNETIHLATVCGGFNAARSLYVLLKSILFHRTNKLQLYVFVDQISRAILEKLLETWKVPDLQVRLINMSSHEHEIAWIPSQHYSHRYGLMKLVFMSVLAQTINHDKKPNAGNAELVILLDTDMLALDNIDKIWYHFKELSARRPGVAIGIVENQSDWYLSDDIRLTGGRVAWPALGRGFNSGLMALNLRKLEALDWRFLWRQVAETQLISHLTTSLADQDIINAVLRERPDLVGPLPCTFNLQLNDHAKLNEMCPTNELVLIHWNSPNKLETRNANARQFKSWYLNFRNWDANLLRRRACYLSPGTGGNETEATAGADATVDEMRRDAAFSSGQHDNATNATGGGSRNRGPSTDSSICSGLRPGPGDTLRTFLYFMPFELGPSDEHDVTLVVHLSVDRLRMLDELAMHWRGPISAAIYLAEPETNLLLESINAGDNLGARRNIGYHLVFRDLGFNYPINRLRNVALNSSTTPYVLLADVDFLPSASLYDELRANLKQLGNLARRALVVPAFESLQYKFEFPGSKAELVKQLDLGSVSMFREQLWPRGHSPTDYAKWRVSTRPYQVEWQPDYEPFVVVARNVSRFDERFVGFGWNKVEHALELAAQGYQFLVLPEAFLVHQFHAASYDIIKHRESVKYRACIRHLKRAFLAELAVRRAPFFERLGAAAKQAASLGASW